MLWAWESPQNLDFIDPHQSGVAFLARTILLRDGSISVRPRVQPLRVASGTALMAVVRIESQGALPRPLDVTPALVESARAAGVIALQIDFDARASERVFYRELIRDVRERLPANMPLSITALASWCDGDGWIADLPVDEAVPMLFRMGMEQHMADESFRVGLCRASAGVSMDEPMARWPRVRRLYVFHPGPWTRTDYVRAMQEAKRWQ
jgi:hypothetical protein